MRQDSSALWNSKCSLLPHSTHYRAPASVYNSTFIFRLMLRTQTLQAFHCSKRLPSKNVFSPKERCYTFLQNAGTTLDQCHLVFLSAFGGHNFFLLQIIQSARSLAYKETVSWKWQIQTLHAGYSNPRLSEYRNKQMSKGGKYGNVCTFIVTASLYKNLSTPNHMRDL